MTTDQLLEAILFAAAKPMSVKQLCDATGEKPYVVETALGELRVRLDAGSGVMLQQNGSSYELVTRPEAADAVARVVTMEATGELTRPSLEALTVIAYCGPMTRPELEQIRGVQSSLILRNLLLRGLIEEKEDTRLGQPVYSVTFDFMNHLGVAGVEALPDYAVLRGNAAISDVLKGLETASTDAAPESPTVQPLV
ncbi:MAG: SMC-Scp complex subunit ScpB [Patescibacteria group bacterium]